MPQWLSRETGILLMRCQEIYCNPPFKNTSILLWWRVNTKGFLNQWFATASCFRSESSCVRSRSGLRESRMAQLRLNPVRSGCKDHRAPFSSCQSVLDSDWNTYLFIWLRLKSQISLVQFERKSQELICLCTIIWCAFASSPLSRVLNEGCCHRAWAQDNSWLLQWERCISILSSTHQAEQLFLLTTVCIDWVDPNYFCFSATAACSPHLFLFTVLRIINIVEELLT